MSAHLKQDKPDAANRLDQMKQATIGQPIPRVEGLAKVTGTAPYAAEYPVEGCAEGVLATATITRGEVVSVDRDSVMDMPGVIAVIEDPRMTTRAAQGTAGRHLAGIVAAIGGVIGCRRGPRHGGKTDKNSRTGRSDSDLHG